MPVPRRTAQSCCTCTVLSSNISVSQQSTVCHGSPRCVTAVHGVSPQSTVCPSSPRCVTAVNGVSQQSTVCHSSLRCVTAVYPKSCQFIPQFSKGRTALSAVQAIFPLQQQTERECLSVCHSILALSSHQSAPHWHFILHLLNQNQIKLSVSLLTGLAVA